MYALEFEAKNSGSYIKLPLDIPTDKSFDMKVIIISSQNIEELKQTSQIDSTNDIFFNILRNRHVDVSNSIDIDELMQDMNNGLSWHKY